MGTGSSSQATVIDGKPEHHTANGFRNPWDTWAVRGFTDIIKWNSNRTTPTLPSKAVLDAELPVLKPNWEAIHNPDPANVQVTWIGHSTFLVQVGGVNVLTDPVFSDRCSPVQFVGPKRYRPVPCTISELPKIHHVLISHNHYDHLDHASVMELESRHQPTFFVPLKLAAWFTSEKVHPSRVVELDWWQSRDVSQTLSMTFLPVQHWSYRNGRDRNETLWGAWGFTHQRNDGVQRKVFFCGDTGYCPAFPQIGERFGPVDVALIPIGAYEPRWFMGPQHVDPNEAVQIALDIRAKRSIGMHWGTFILTDEPVLEPRSKLAADLQERNLQPEFFVTLKHGETIQYTDRDLADPDTVMELPNEAVVATTSSN